MSLRETNIHVAQMTTYIFYMYSVYLHSTSGFLLGCTFPVLSSLCMISFLSLGKHVLKHIKSTLAITKRTIL